MMRRTTLVCLLLAAGVAGAAPAEGLGINGPLAARLTGSGNVLYITSIDVANHGGGDRQVDFYFDGVNLVTQAPLALTGSVTNDGLRAQGLGVLRGRTTAYFEDFVSSLAAASFIPQETVSDGVLGSVLFVFGGVTESGQGAVTARFKNDLAGGTVGVALRGRVLTAREPRQLVVSVRDTRANARGDARVYPNAFINHTGLTSTGEGTTDPVTVELAAVSSRTGQAIGTKAILIIRSGHTVIVGSVLTALQVPAGEESILLFARVTAGNGAIQGIVSQVDEVTRDGSLFEMSRGDFQ
jgi:hypothetical protein